MRLLWVRRGRRPKSDGRHTSTDDGDFDILVLCVEVVSKHDVDRVVILAAKLHGCV